MSVQMAAPFWQVHVLQSCCQDLPSSQAEAAVVAESESSGGGQAILVHAHLFPSAEHTHVLQSSILVLPGVHFSSVDKI